LNKTLPIKGINQQPIKHEESDDDESEFLKGNTMIAEEIEKHPMNKLKKQITKAQEEYKSNHKQPD
jgi:hypothetical protein